MSSTSRSKTKRPDIDRSALVKAIKLRVSSLKAATRSHAKGRQFGRALEADAMVTAYLYLLQGVDKGLFDTLPKEKSNGRE